MKASPLDFDPDAEVLRRILAENPSLSWRGWWGRRNEISEPPGTLERVRGETQGEFGLAQFSRAMGFLEIAPRTKGLNRRHCAYGWKHRVEAWARSINPSRGQDYYCGEGCFIAACLASGLLIQRGGLATYVNLATSAWELGEPRLASIR
jgi:hypothetical protein